MYGMVNRALQSLIVGQHGESTWKEIKSKAGVTLEDFSSLAAYDDKITYDLAIAASEVLQAPVPDLLRAFGQYWIEFAQQSSYAVLLEQAGSNLHELLPALDDMHTRLALSFPELQPPSFEVLEDTGDRILLRYSSERPALAPFVVGLIEGLAKSTDTEVEVGLTESKDEGAAADVFEVLIKN